MIATQSRSPARQAGRGLTASKIWKLEERGLTAIFVYRPNYQITRPLRRVASSHLNCKYAIYAVSVQIIYMINQTMTLIKP